jgi:acyl-CoA thioesterase I
MKKYSLFTFAFAALFGSWVNLSHAIAAAAPTILVMGDSLSAAYGIPTDAGWVSLLQRRLKAQGYDARVVNASVSGETTAGGLARLPQALDQHDPEFVIIELGANDGLRGMSPSVIKENLRRMVELSRAHGARVLLTGVRIPTNYGEAYRQLYYSQYEAVAEETGVPLVPFLLKGVVQNPELLQDDGLHPTAAAQPRILNNVWPALTKLLEAAPTNSHGPAARLR